MYNDWIFENNLEDPKIEHGCRAEYVRGRTALKMGIPDILYLYITTGNISKMAPIV